MTVLKGAIVSPDERVGWSVSIVMIAATSGEQVGAQRDSPQPVTKVPSVMAAQTIVIQAKQWRLRSPIVVYRPQRTNAEGGDRAANVRFIRVSRAALRAFMSHSVRLGIPGRSEWH